MQVAQGVVSPPQIVLPPNLPLTDGTISTIRRAKRKVLLERSLIEFCKDAWEIIEPGSSFIANWHLDVIAEHLEAVSRGDIKDLLINIPPGCCKSILVSVMWPAWVWAKDPSKRFLGASYGEELAIRDSMKCRDIVTSDWFQGYWPEVAIKQGDDQKIKYGLTGGGWRLATSVGGRATGEHPDIKIVDDPLSAAQGNSEAERARAVAWFDQTLSTRGVSRGAATVVVMQRLHEKDVAGHILSDIGGYEHLCLPMRFEGRKSVYYHRDDPRTEIGQLLWPELFPEDTTLILEKRLGEYGAAGQLQQQPSPPGGGILKTEHLKKWPANTPLPSMQYIITSLDTAFTEKTTGDPTACTVWGVFSHEKRQAVMLLDAWADHLSYPKLREKVIKDWSATYGSNNVDGVSRVKRSDLVLVEQKGSGQSILQDLRAANIPARGYNPGRADKISRAHQISPILELGVIYVPESAKDKGGFVSWARPFLQQLERFPNAAHDDYIDTMSQCFIYLRDSGFLELPYSDLVEEVEEVDYVKHSRVNPYAC